MGREIYRPTPQRTGRRHGDLMRAWQPRPRSDVHKVERIYDGNGRLIGERATRSTYTISELDPRVLGQMMPVAVGAFNAIVPGIFVFSMIGAWGGGGPIAGVLAVVVWVMMLGVEGLLWLSFLGGGYLVVACVAGAIWGDRAAWIAALAAALFVAVETWRAAR